MNTPEIIFSVSEFIEYINIAVGRSVSVEGEVSGYNVSQGKWIFFDLKDENGKIGCFASLWTLHTTLEDGMKIVAHGTPRIYPRYGKFSLTIERIELRGDGALRRAFELTKKKLEEEGLFDVSRKRALPRFPEHIGVIASRDSAAYADFMRIVRSRWSGCTVSLIHVQVQGDRAITDIVRAFEWFNTHGIDRGIEALALIRGGGSLEDLQAFNSESVARAVFGAKIPVVCGVGHEPDESLADYAADMRAATPTHAAGLIVPDREEIRAHVESFTSTLYQSVVHFLEWHEAHVRTVQYSLEAGVRRHASAITDLLHDMAIVGERNHARIVSLRESCAFFERTLAQMNPLTVLSRGYTIVKRGGTLVAHAHDVREGDQLTVTFSDGDVATKAL
ncbi:MAG: exodeoxyribonuclease VII large subunit [Patescibacteria group bacterium]